MLERRTEISLRKKDLRGIRPRVILRLTWREANSRLNERPATSNNNERKFLVSTDRVARVVELMLARRMEDRIDSSAASNPRRCDRETG